MGNTTELLKQLHTASELFDEAIHLRYNESMAIREVYGEEDEEYEEYEEYEEPAPPIPQPEIAKYHMQSFSDEDCKNLAKGTLELAPYKRKMFSLIPSYPKPTYWHISTFIMIALTAIAILLLSFFLSTNAEIGTADKQVELAQTECAGISDLFEEDNYVTWRELWYLSPTTARLKEGWSPVERAWSERGYIVTVATLENIFDNSDSNGSVLLSTFENNLFRFLLVNHQTTFNHEVVDVVTDSAGFRFVVSDDWYDRMSGTKNALLTLSIIFFVAMVICEIVRIVRKETLFSYISNKKMYMRAWKREAIDRIEHEKEQKKIEAEYNAEVKSEPARYKKIYDEYLVELKAYEERRDEYYRNKEAIKQENLKRLEQIEQENLKRLKQIADEIRSLNMLPTKYGDGVNRALCEFDGKIVYKGGDLHTLEALKSEINSIIKILKDGRADTYKEAMNCLISDDNDRKRYEIAQMQANAVYDIEIENLEAQIDKAIIDYKAGRICDIEKNEIIHNLKRRIYELEQQKI